MIGDMLRYSTEVTYALEPKYRDKEEYAHGNEV